MSKKKSKVRKASMTIGVTEDNTYLMPVCMLNHHGFEVGDQIEFVGCDDGCVVARKKS